ncbi:MAG TPA: DUF3307 domain-containing protein [Chryseolinea sp.]|mgnify:CR=1 FL=1|nr:DUF3307 domain-containing protein [Chryseolinea sp.]HPH46973.1 DUF3307 domain-containing protein [Chryseolinea sp.]HPM30476.1 DUF3307 domain-containing protein [Chryseolinea sp.]
MIVFIKLILAHLLGDFFLQPTSWVKAKEKKKLGAYQLYLHVLLHGVLIMLLIWDWAFLPWAATIAFVHFIIDALKLILQKKENRTIYFMADQTLHILSLYLIFSWYQGRIEISTSFFTDENFMLATMVIFLTIPTSYLTSMLISKWTPHTEEETSDSLENAGKYIGILERLFVFVFVVSGRWEPIGFLLAAKSIFRFGDLKKPRDRKLTEYILIGTLISFGISILTGMAYLAWLKK